ncbi:glycoside hydrolase family 32 protein [Rufibacter hautae]|uniref:Glycoside hydrolase family 32 protein n=1 Tax=Rufibacter hautae TaxID=2595005 RepID=A0A5B6TBJ2_9BACT|nr:glycoside hydrolase family 32 protein [Rufibacter hautae]KAA3437857.1 glycoside hydrolase family 32 protein [Rufibacter hautae]
MGNLKGLVATCLLGISATVGFGQKAAPEVYKEPYRPQYHFSPAKGWIGDPCGFMYYQNKYHMFWWGKVTSEDLVHYKEESPKVMKGDSGGIAYFTGSALVDKDNTAGFGPNTQIAVYTLFNEKTKNQSQGISFSKDGKTFQYYEGNPVLDIGSTEFRDPTVFWHAPTSKWVMVVAKALEKKIKFYSSPDLKKWTWLSDFGPKGAQEKAWECPDIFQLSVDGNPDKKKWVMVVSIDWAREQYFMGDFDGTNFTLDKDHPEHPLYVDQGLDFYASRTFMDFDNTLKTTTSLGWVATWDYAPLAPTSWGKGFWSIPRDLELKTFPEGVRLVQKPIKNLETLRESQVSFKQKLSKGTEALKKFAPTENVYELDATFSTEVENTVGFNLCVGSGRKVAVRYDTRTQLLTIDRTNCSDVPIEKFARTTSAKVTPVKGKVRMHFYVDKSSIELFTNEGKEVFTLLTYPADTQTGIETFAEKDGTKLELTAYKLKSIWNNSKL